MKQYANVHVIKNSGIFYVQIEKNKKHSSLKLETVIRMSHDTSILIAIISHNFEFKPWAEQRFGFKTS